MLNSQNVDKIKDPLTITIIVPCHNEEGNVELLYEKVKATLSGYSVEFIFVDDNSNDQTLPILQTLSLNDPFVKYISLSKNFGHQSALRAGFEYSTVL